MVFVTFVFVSDQFFRPDFGSNITVQVDSRRTLIGSDVGSCR